jgi:periplasmic divalent cation tolerance protein
MPTGALLVFCTFPDLATAREIIRTLVDERLIACGNLVPGVESIYRWEGKVETSAEILGVIKTDSAAYERMQLRLKELHPYDVPECIAIPIAAGLPSYLAWIADSTAA